MKKIDPRTDAGIAKAAYIAAIVALESYALEAAEAVHGLEHGFGNDDLDILAAYTIPELAFLQKRLQDLHESMEASKNRVGVMFDHIRTNVLPTKMDSEDISKIGIDGLGTVVLTDDLRVKVLDTAKEFDWLEEIGAGDLIASTVNSSSLKALLRRRMNKGETVPSDIFDVKPFVRASITKERKK